MQGTDLKTKGIYILPLLLVRTGYTKDPNSDTILHHYIHR